MKKKLLMISHSQFGYLAGYVQYCKYLKEDFDITFLCWDYRKEMLEEQGVSIYYISRQGSLLARNIRFITTVMNFLKTTKYHCVFMCYFQGSSVIPLLYRGKQFIHLNIMTGSVSWNAFRRKAYNTIMRLESYFFKSVSTISKSLKSYLKIRSDALIFPLGADPIERNPKVEHKLDMIYVGTFSERKIEDTIEGLHLFLHKNPNADVFYTIIGSGWKDEVDLINEKTKKYNLEKYVSLKGYILQKDLKQYYERANVGIAYIPKTPYYDCQPSTKIYEYLMAGLPVIATDTFENKRIINSDNGILTDHTPGSFAMGLTKIYKEVNHYTPGELKNSVKGFEWKSIVDEMKEEITNFTLTNNPVHYHR